MCLIAFGWQAHPRWPLVVAANRDEFHGRPTAAAHWWAEPTGLFAGADLEAGGGWCGMDRLGRFAAVTNVRETDTPTGQRSRGLLVRDYFAQTGNAADWAAHTADQGQAFGAFNLLIGDTHSLWFVSNRGRVRYRQLGPGVHAISNGHWGDHWPKTERAQARLRDRLAGDGPAPAALFDLLADTEPAAPDQLPDTGVGATREQFLSPLFIRSRVYGTRASTVIRRDTRGRVDFHEIGYDPQGEVTHQVAEQWAIEQEYDT